MLFATTSWRSGLTRKRPPLRTAAKVAAKTIARRLVAWTTISTRGLRARTMPIATVTVAMAATPTMASMATAMPSLHRPWVGRRTLTCFLVSEKSFGAFLFHPQIPGASNFNQSLMTARRRRRRRSGFFARSVQALEIERDAIPEASGVVMMSDIITSPVPVGHANDGGFQKCCGLVSS